MSMWHVGRGELGACYVDEGGPSLGELPFDTEADALEYAILCDGDIAAEIRRALRTHRSRLRRLNRKSQTPAVREAEGERL